MSFFGGTKANSADENQTPQDAAFQLNCGSCFVYGLNKLVCCMYGEKYLVSVQYWISARVLVTIANAHLIDV